MLVAMSDQRERPRRSVEWPVAGEGLRERKKRLTRQRLSDTATAMFLERGFDGVRVSEIARACGVSETTAFNYFPTKESLILDRWEGTSAGLRDALADRSSRPVTAVVRLLAQEIAALTGWLGAQDDFARAADEYRRFGELLHSTPSLSAHQHATTEWLIGEAAGVLAERVDARPSDPEPLIVANALIGLWRVQARSITAHLASAATPRALADAVAADVEQAARVLDTGLSDWS